MKGEDLVETKTEIQSLGLAAIKDFFGVDPSGLEPQTIKVLHDKARIGMQFEREMNLTKRAVEMNYLRVFRLIAEDKKELKKYINAAMPHYIPDGRRKMAAQI